MGVIEASGFARKGVQMTEEKQGAAEWLRKWARIFGSADAYSCKKFMADEFGVSCSRMRCTDCNAVIFERIADRIESERQLPEGVEWPRFEDGELVGFGDEVEFEGETWKVTGVGFESPGFDIGLRCGLNIGAMSGSYGELVKRPTPKVLDADGAPINVGDTVWCGEDQLSVVCFTVGAAGDVRTTVKDDEGMHYTLKPSCLSRKRPDSWERLEEDAKLAPRDYLEKRGMNPEKTERIASMMADLVRRAKALAKGEQR